MRVGKDGVETRRGLLEAAREVFSEKGFRDATIADICELDGANTAAVNYHFRDKETLYVEAWRVAFERSLQAHPPDGGVPPDAPAEERLRGRILSLLQRIADPASHEFEIVHKELANPTGLLVEVMHESIEPIHRGLLAIARELLGGDAPERDVMLCAMSIRAQCYDLLIHRRHGGSHPGPPLPPGLPAFDLDIEVIAEHVTRFSLAGICDVRRRVGSDGPGKTGVAP